MKVDDRKLVDCSKCGGLHLDVNHFDMVSTFETRTVITCTRCGKYVTAQAGNEKPNESYALARESWRKLNNG